MDSIIVGLVLLWLVFGLIFAIHVAEREHKECAVLRTRAAELEARVAELEAALADSQQQQGTLIWGGNPVPVVFAPADTAQGRGGQVIVTDFSLGVGRMEGGSGGSGGILVADGEAEAGREE